MKISNSHYGVILSIPGLIIIIALVIFPLITLLITSVLRYTSIYPITFTGFKNYQYIFGDRLFWLGLEKTVVYSGGVTALTFCGGVILALLLSKITRASAFFRSLSMFSWAVPLVISGFIWRWIFNPNVGVFSDFLMKLKLISKPLPVFSDSTLSMIACVVADAWVRIPFMCVFTLAAIESIPRSLYDAAKVDGADCVDAFRYITLPHIKHMVLIGLLITSMISFRTIDVIFAMTGGGPGRDTYVLSLYIIDQLWLRVNYGTGSAASVIMFLLIASFAGYYVYLIFKEE
ncbi:MAG: sugar ABC transporter permease [Desulfobacterales bacterium]|nr:MAG: sugar ABC transporter permease [Desulfobacterales bacterium]